MDVTSKSSSAGQRTAQKRKQTEKVATALIVLGMAGSGKTTVVQRLLAEAEERNLRMFTLNLDPAVGGGSREDQATTTPKTSDAMGDAEEDDWTGLPYDPNVDIRDSINYKQVMKLHGLGPNGAIMTCLNLYTTRFHEVVEIFERRKKTADYIIIDTPGQIEVFTWSASGSIITETTAGMMPTVLVYVVDTPRTKSPATFSSNMLYACSVMFRTKLPMVLVFNKVDVEPHEFAVKWMTDIESFQEAVDEESDSGDYMSSLTRSMGLVLNEFYSTLQSVGVSAATGEGMDDFFVAVDRAVEEYTTEYLPEIESRKEELRKQVGLLESRSGRAGESHTRN
jgi:GTPase SAR1 family protein